MSGRERHHAVACQFGSGDPYDSGAGTLGSQACVDTVMVVEHDDKSPRLRINYKGRDIERGFIDLDHTKDSPLWKIAAPIIESTEEKALSKRKNGHTSSNSVNDLLNKDSTSLTL